ncbi:MAG: SDR family NAD(P)-dependent oxidoreductase [Pseudomonadales bacterium]
MGKLQDKVAIITGGSGGIGEAVAKRYLAEGAKVMLVDLDGEALATVAARLGDDVAVYAGDITTPEANAAMVTLATERFGGVDIFLANAGIEGTVAPLTTQSVEVFDRVMAVNVKSTFLTTKHALPLMREDGARHPAIVNISSIEGLGANPLHGVYAASKAAVAAFSHNTALEYGPYGIRCNAVAPGWINTPFNEQLLAQYPDRAAVDAAIEALHPVGRLGSPEDVANTVFWLASSDAAFVTGQEVVVDGGRLAKLPLPAL